MEKANFFVQKFKNKNSNDRFLEDNSSIKMPPDFYMYETHNLNYDKFYHGGFNTAEWVVNLLSEYADIYKGNILDWGCGPGRVLRHMPDIVNSSNRVYGCDYNAQYVIWCNNNLRNVEVRKNELYPPLSFENEFFDAIYGISIFTHLSEEMHFKWMQELNRVCKNQGVILLTVHGDCFKINLSQKERVLFDSGKLVSHKFKVEGNRLYASYQPVKFFRNLAESNGFKILEHVKGEIKNNKPQQDVWIIKKID
ncbi:MAG: class I SAM-dependent methyltransferase [Flavobacteriaceae bacterium]|nr:class I SAM-dependent methyltransferase [Flavobacteriaceae bacterium]